MARLDRNKPAPDYRPVYNLALLLGLLIILVLALVWATEPKIYLLGA